MKAGGGSTAPSLVGRLAHWLDGLLGLVAAVLLFLMMALTFVDVLGRDLLNKPVPGAFELTEIMMGVLIFAGLPLISRRDGHIAVNLFDHLMSPSALRLRQSVMDLIVAASTGAIAWVLWEKAVQLSTYGDATAYLRLPISPVIRVMAVLAALTTVGMIAKAWASWRAFRHGGHS